MKSSLIIVVFVASAGLAGAQETLPSGPQVEFEAFTNCAMEKAAGFAHLDGSLGEIATAAIGACGREKTALQHAYQQYASSQAPAGSPKRNYGAMFIESTVEGMMPQLMASVAEARTN